MHRERILDEIFQNLCGQVKREDLTMHQSWWMNRRTTGGLRLSREAHCLLITTDLPHWSFDLNPTWITPKNMLRMDRLIPVPYSIDVSDRPRRAWVTVWDSGQAMTIELLGNFDRFLAALERAWSRSPEKK